MLTSSRHQIEEFTAESGISVDELRSLITRALQEDIGAGDITTRLTLPDGLQVRGTFRSKQGLVVAGLPVASQVFRTLDLAIDWQPEVDDGADVAPGTSLGSITGSAATLLTGERVALNFLQHLSGIATLTRRFVDQIEGLKSQLLDTRKTIPGLRSLEKYAVRVGGGSNHRLRLDDGILIKNNHLRLAGSVRSVVQRAREGRDGDLPVEVEVANRVELDEAIAAGADRVLLDNMTPEQVRECVARAAGKVQLEVSGGVNVENVRAYAETGVDFISVGALTHSAPAADIHFVVEPL